MARNDEGSEERLVNFTDGFKLAGVSRRTFWRWLQAGKIRPVVDGRGRPLVVSSGGKPGPVYRAADVIAAADEWRGRARLVDGRLVGGDAPAPGPRKRRLS